MHFNLVSVGKPMFMIYIDLFPIRQIEISLFAISMGGSSYLFSSLLALLNLEKMEEERDG